MLAPRGLSESSRVEWRKFETRSRVELERNPYQARGENFTKYSAHAESHSAGDIVFLVGARHSPSRTFVERNSPLRLAAEQGTGMEEEIPRRRQRQRRRLRPRRRRHRNERLRPEAESLSMVSGSCGSFYHRGYPIEREDRGGWIDRDR